MSRRSFVVMSASLLGACTGDPRAVRDGADAAASFVAAPDARAPSRACAFAMPNPATTAAPHPAQYDLSVAGVTRDLVTGLEWQRDELSGRLSQPEAAAACAALSLDGHVAWRLPSRLELVSLVDYARNFPAIDVTSFADTAPEFYWTATSVADYPDRAWYVGFAYGFVFGKERTAPALARCVRNGTPCTCSSPRFVVDGDEATIVHDADTGLAWLRRPLADHLSWQDANAACAARNEGWRLPTMKELQTIIDDERTGGARFYADAFPDVPGDLYWTSSPIDGVANHAWYVNFLFGNPDYDGMPERNAVLCVR
jgi:hypothetical protein